MTIKPQEQKFIPPQNLEAEKSILGALMIDKNSILKVIDILTPGDFYEDRNGIIFESMIDLFKKHSPIDILTLSSLLNEKNKMEQIGTVSYLGELASSVPTASHVEQYAKIVKEKSALRKLAKSGHKIVSLAFEEDQPLPDLLEQAEQSLFGVSQNFLKENFVHIKKVINTSFEKLSELHSNKGKNSMRGVASGFRDLDRILSGFQPSDLIILAARPSIGKTSLALNFAEHVACNLNKGIGIFSLEMSKEQLVERLFSSLMKVDSWRLRTGNLTDEDFSRMGGALDKLSQAQLFIDDSATLNLIEIRAKARRLQAEQGISMLIIDYLQLISGSNPQNRVQEISTISRGLKALARELNIPVLALSQLSRQVESRDNKRPQLSDLRDSGSIEQDADIVLMMYRDDYYHPDSSKAGVVELSIRKHRNGPTGKIDLIFQKEQMRYLTIDREHQVVT